MKNKKGNVAVIAIVIVIVAITAGVIGYLFANKKQVPVQQETIKTVQQPAQATAQTTQIQPVAQPVDETANWQTLSDNKMGISFKIPSNWVGNFSDIIGSDKNRSFDALRDGVPFDKNTKLGDYSINMMSDSIDSEVGKNFVQTIKDIKAGKAEKSTASQLTTLKLGVEALKSLSESPYPAPESQKENAVIYNFIAGGKYFSVTATYSGNGKSDGVGEKIVSTIKLTN
jgi:hypothetical protein